VREVINLGALKKKPEIICQEMNAAFIVFIYQACYIDFKREFFDHS
jgi:hypothetical protein